MVSFEIKQTAARDWATAAALEPERQGPIMRFISRPGAGLPFAARYVVINLIGLALIGAVVAEFVAGTGGAETGLAFRILEAGYRLAIPRLFAALFLLSLTGIVIYLLLDWLSRRVLRHWHESAGAREEE